MSNNGENLFLEAEDSEKNYRNSLIQRIKASGIGFNDFEKVSLFDLAVCELGISSIETEHQQTADMLNYFNKEVSHFSEEKTYGNLAIVQHEEQPVVRARVVSKGKVGKVFRGK